MRVDIHPVYNVNIYLFEFFNVDLEERGYYQIRVRPKRSSEFWTLDIVSGNSEHSNVEREISSPVSNLIPATVENGVGISKIVEITYIDEKIPIDNTFTITIQLRPPANICEKNVLEVEIELWYMDRYRPPRLDLFEKRAKRTIQIPLNPVGFVAEGRSIFLECSNLAAISLCAFSSLVMISTRRKKSQTDLTQLKYQKIQKMHKNTAQCLLLTIQSIQRFLFENSKLMNICISVDIIDVENEIIESTKLLENSESTWTTFETSLSEWSARLTLIYQQMTLLIIESPLIWTKLLRNYDKKRRAILGEAFFCTERLIENILFSKYSNLHEFYNIVSTGKYLKNIPKLPLFCEETDSPGSNCPIIFEEIFSRLANFDEEFFKTQCNKKIQESPVKIKEKDEKTEAVTIKSFKERIRREASKSLKAVKPRRKSLDFSETLLKENLKINNTSKVSSEIDVETTTEASELSERCSAAGNAEKEHSVQLSMSSNNILRKKEQIIENIGKENATEIQNVVEFLKDREELKRKLREELDFDGFIYSEKAQKSIHIVPFLPVSSPSSSSNSESSSSLSSRMGKNAHLVVFVHGLEGSHDDLIPYRWSLKQAVEGYLHCRNLESSKNAENHWKFEYLMSRANLTETWTDIKTMAHNIISEIQEFVEEYSGNIKRISFIAHSLGGVIVRTAVGLAIEMKMEWLIDHLYTFLTINSPHLGLAYVGKHIHWGVQLVKWWKRSQSIEQLSFRDSLTFSETFLYKLSSNMAFAKFKNILLIGSPHDQIVPHTSSLLLPSKHSSKDSSAFGTAYREMLSNVLSSIISSEKTENFVRFTTFHQITTAHSNRITGRAAHIAAVEDSVFIEKLFSISAYKYFV